MDVRCEKCLTEYEFDDAKVTEAGVTVKCTTCGFVFKVKRMVAPLPTGAPATTTAPTIRTDEFAPEAAQIDRVREWKIRQPGGSILTCRELTTLQKWIVERKVAREDEISLTGESWKRLGEIPELAGFFMVVDQANRASVLEQQLRAGPQMMGAPQPGMGHAPTMMSMPSAPRTQTDAYQLGQNARTQTQEPAWMASPSSGGDDLEDDDLQAIKRRGPGTALGIGVLLLAVVGGAVVYVKFGDQILGKTNHVAATTGTVAATTGEPPAPTTTGTLAQAAAGGTTAAVAVPVAAASSGSGATSTSTPSTTSTAGATSSSSSASTGTAGTTSSSGSTGATSGTASSSGAAASSGTTGAARPATSGGSEKPIAEESGTGGKATGHSANFYIAQGDAFERRDRSEAALRAYEKAIEIDPSSVEAWGGKAKALFDLGNNAESMQAARRTLTLSPSYGDAEQLMGELYAAQGNKPAARAALKKFIDDHPGDDDVPAARNRIKDLSQ